MTQARQFLGGSAWSVGSLGVSQVIGLAVLAYMARYLEAHEFGVVAISVLALELTRDLMHAGLPDYLVREKVWHDDVANSAFTFQLLAGVALGAVMLAAGMLVSALISADIGLALMAMSGVYLIEAAGSVSNARLRHDMNFRAIGMAQIAGAAATMGIAVLALQAEAGFLALIYCRLGAGLVSTAISLACSPWTPRLTTNLAPLRPLLSYAVNIISTKLVSILNVKATDIIIGLLGGPALLGAYQLASRLLNFVLQTVLSPIQTVCLSVFAKQSAPGQLQTSVQNALSMLALAVFPIAVGLAVVAPEVVGIIFGPGWHALALPMAILMLACLPASINYLLYPVLVKVDRADLAVRFVSVLTVTGIVLTLITAPFGLVAVAAAFTARTLIGSAISLRMLRRELGLEIKALLATLAVPAAGCVAIVLTAVALRSQVQVLPELQRLMVLALAGASAYLVVLALFWRKAPFVQALVLAKGKA